MQQRQPRVGDILDDYCPRERRLTDHAVVAMVEDEIRQTRCTTCDAEHEYRQGKIPPVRKKATAALPPKPPAGAVTPRLVEPVEAAGGAAADAAPADDDRVPDAEARPAAAGAPEGPVHRRLIRAVLPRIEGEVPVRPAPEFTMHRAAMGTKPPAHGRPPRGAHGAGQARQGGLGHTRHAAGSHNGAPGNRASRGPHAGPGGHASRGNHAGPGGQGGHHGHGGQRHGRPQGGGRGPGNKH